MNFRWNAAGKKLAIGALIVFVVFALVIDQLAFWTGSATLDLVSDNVVHIKVAGYPVYVRPWLSTAHSWGSAAVLTVAAILLVLFVAQNFHRSKPPAS